jgi:hypothetical protein
MLRRLVKLFVVAGGALAGVALRRRFGGSSGRVDVHFDDGSLVSYGSRAQAAQPLLSHARDALSAARS